jgi:hypothetical protein
MATVQLSRETVFGVDGGVRLRASEGRQAETTVRGTVQNVSRQNQEKMGRGTHVTLRAEGGSTHNVYLGPQDYLQQQGLQVCRNDKLEVTGSRATDRMAPGAADRTSPDELYDRKAEATIRGTVEDLRVFARPGMSAKQHAIVRTQDGQEITVQLGPPSQRWLANESCTPGLDFHRSEYFRIDF